MKRKGFTLVELLVVIGIIALLMGILLPTLSRVKQYAYRMLCGTNLSGLGKAMMMYAQDNDELFPRGGGKQSYWGSNGYIGTASRTTPGWSLITEAQAFGGTSGCSATITSSFYLLVRDADVSPRQFLCKGDTLASAFEPSAYLPGFAGSISDAWDFGTQPAMHCSYSYHLPYDEPPPGSGLGRPLTSASNTACPLGADRNPYLDDEAVSYLGGLVDDEVAPYWDDDTGTYADPDKAGNAAAHQRDGQNVMYLDTHVSFERYPNVGIENDNIWLYWPNLNPLPEVKQVYGNPPDPGIPTTGAGVGMGTLLDYKDAYLVSEDQRVVGAPPM